MPVDRLGDPLPSGALARFGTARLHHGGALAGVGSFGRTLVSIGSGIGLHGPNIKLWDPKSGRLVATAHVDGAHTSAVDHAGRYLVVGSFVAAFVFEAKGNEMRSVALPKGDGALQSVAITRDGRTLAVLRTHECSIEVYRTTPVRHVRSVGCAVSSAHALAISDDGSLFAIADDEGGLSVVDATTGAPRLTHAQPSRGNSRKVVKDRYLWRIAADPKRARVAFADTDEKIALLDLASGAVREVGAHVNRVDALAFSPSGERLASASADDSVLVWDVKTK